MRYVFTFFIFCSLASAQMLQSITNDVHHSGGGAVTWTKIQDTQTDNSTGTCSLIASTCTITVPSTTAGDVLVGFSYSGNSFALTSVTGDGTWTHCSNCAVSNATVAAGVDMAYRAVATGGATSIVFTFSGTTSSFTAVEVVQFRRSTGSATFDVSGSVNDSTNCTACTGVPLTLTGGGSNELIVSVFTESQTLSTVNSPYILGSLPEQFMTYWLTATTGTAPVANQSPTGQMIFAAVSFK